jgi:nucleotide-binding universal stress UspA family protein
MENDTFKTGQAVEDFYRIRRRASLRRFLRQMARREDDELVAYEEVRKHLTAVESSERRLEDVPLDAIVGSVGRYADFTSEFMPKNNADRDRWVRVKMAMTGIEGVPPIEVYKLGEAYFVRDGNHRVSVAREMGFTHLQAYVTPVKTNVPFRPGDDPKTVMLEGERRKFLDATGLDRLRPQSDLNVSEPGAYERLREHISVHRYFMGIDEDRPVGWPEAVEHWHDAVYRPVLASIRQSGILEQFPGRTEADLYLWLADHRAHLEREVGWRLPSDHVVQGLTGAAVAKPDVRDALLSDLAEHPERRADVAFADDVLVAFDLGEPGRKALAQALAFAKAEGSRLYGLRATHGVVDENERQATEAAFKHACREAGVDGQLAFAEGNPVDAILDRSIWADLVVATLVYEENRGGGRSLARNVRPLLRRTPRPLLAVAGPPSDLSRPLLAYDGRPQADLALFAAVYASLKWDRVPTVLTVSEVGRSADATLEKARRVFERYGAKADYVQREGAVGDAIVQVASERDCNLIVMGSYTYSRWLEGVFGGVLEHVLLHANQPVLIA